MYNANFVFLHNKLEKRRNKLGGIPHTKFMYQEKTNLVLIKNIELHAYFFNN